MSRSRPVLYLDIDDTLVVWADDAPSGAPGVREFLLWALEHFEVRWLTRWARDGRLDETLLADLSRLTGVEVEALRPVQGLDWSGTTSKLNGVAWLEHTILGRPFLWIEDDTVEPGALEFLEAHALSHRFRRCDVSRDRESLSRLHDALSRAAA